MLRRLAPLRVERLMRLLLLLLLFTGPLRGLAATRASCCARSCLYYCSVPDSWCMDMLQCAGNMVTLRR